MENRSWLYFGAAIVLLLLATALFAPALAPYDPLAQNLDQDLRASSRAHWLGTDKLGRDILSRTIYGGRISLLVGLSTVALSLIVGVAVGSLAGYFGGWVDQLVIRAIGLFMSFFGILFGISCPPA